jgi:hypothetical protein
MQYNPGWESGSMKTLAAHGLAGGIMQDRMGGSCTACCDVGNCITHSVSNNHLNKDTCKIYRNGFGNYCHYKSYFSLFYHYRYIWNASSKNFKQI